MPLLQSRMVNHLIYTETLDHDITDLIFLFFVHAFRWTQSSPQSRAFCVFYLLATWRSLENHSRTYLQEINNSRSPGTLTEQAKGVCKTERQVLNPVLNQASTNCGPSAYIPLETLVSTKAPVLQNPALLRQSISCLKLFPCNEPRMSMDRWREGVHNNPAEGQQS